MAGKKSTTKKTTRKAQPWMKTQAEVVRLIIKKEGGKDKCSWKDGIKKLKPYIKKAIGKEYKKGGDITWGEAINKTKVMLTK